MQCSFIARFNVFAFGLGLFAEASLGNGLMKWETVRRSGRDIQVTDGYDCPVLPFANVY